MHMASACSVSIVRSLKNYANLPFLTNMTSVCYASSSSFSSKGRVTTLNRSMQVSMHAAQKHIARYVQSIIQIH